MLARVPAVAVPTRAVIPVMWSNSKGQSQLMMGELRAGNPREFRLRPQNLSKMILLNKRPAIFHKPFIVFPHGGVPSLVLPRPGYEDHVLEAEAGPAAPGGPGGPPSSTGGGTYSIADSRVLDTAGYRPTA